MGRLSRFLDLPWRDKALLLQAALLLASIRLGLSALPFATLRSYLAKLAASGMGGSRAEDDPGGTVAERTVWAVESVGRHLPVIGTCLTQALAAHVLLGRAGRKSNLRIGAKRNADGNFVAHAWLEQDGVVLIGGACHERYTPMPALNGLEPRS